MATDDLDIHDFSPVDLQKIFVTASRARWPRSRRPWVSGTSICLGLAKAEGGGTFINPGDFISNGFLQQANQGFASTLRSLSRTFVWTSLQVNWNTVAAWHQDSGNSGPSAMVVAGTFEDGQFELDRHPPVQLRGRIIFFCGRDWHRSHEFSGGDRLSLVAFRHELADACTKDQRRQLADLGFQLSAGAPGARPKSGGPLPPAQAHLRARPSG